MKETTQMLALIALALLSEPIEKRRRLVALIKELLDETLKTK